MCGHITVGGVCEISKRLEVLSWILKISIGAILLWKSWFHYLWIHVFTPLVVHQKPSWYIKYNIVQILKIRADWLAAQYIDRMSSPWIPPSGKCCHQWPYQTFFFCFSCPVAVLCSLLSQRKTEKSKERHWGSEEMSSFCSKQMPEFGKEI